MVGSHPTGTTQGEAMTESEAEELVRVARADLDATRRGEERCRADHAEAVRHTAKAERVLAYAEQQLARARRATTEGGG
jgi:hypothetical protein